jgi:hypothetical protein
VILHGPVPRAQVQHALASANVLVNIGNSTPHQLPSKIVEYMMTGKPILNVVQRPNDPSGDVLGAYPLVFTLDTSGDPAPESCMAQAGALARWLSHLPRPLGQHELAPYTKAFTVESVAGQYLVLLETPWRPSGRTAKRT